MTSNRKRLKRHCLCAGAVLTLGCGTGAVETRGAAQDEEDDPCTVADYYDDECDEDCKYFDEDCRPSCNRQDLVGVVEGMEEAWYMSCAADEYCYFGLPLVCGLKASRGKCYARPTADECEEANIAGPVVCGCDEVTYPSECAAHRAGWSVAYEGECVGGGLVVCGGTYTEHLECEADEYCNFPTRPDLRCGHGHYGFCAPRPPMNDCADPQDVPPEEVVCGCDTHTYKNACQANASGTDFIRRRECGANPRCRGPEDCFAEEYCEFPGLNGNVCGSGNEEGWCKERPATCGPRDSDDLVCGCDNITYDSLCHAEQNGSTFKHLGACGSEDAPACDKEHACPDSASYCSFANGLCGENGDKGTCRSTSSLCPAYFEPVCGCNGIQYNNDCFAHLAGTDVASGGDCGL